MLIYKVTRLLLHLMAGLATCAFVFPLIDKACRQQRIQRWSSKLLSLCGIQLKIRKRSDVGDLVPALIVSNHVSWLDIFVINSLHPCRFVAKSDIRNWPLIGWLCEQAGTIFIARGRQRDVRRIYEGIVASIHDGERVAFFPEGATAAQGSLLPFHANLFEAAIVAQVPVQPCALRYLDDRGRLHAAADFIGDMSFFQSVVTILRAKKITAELILLPAMESHGRHRRELAAAAQGEIATALGYASSYER